MRRLIAGVVVALAAGSCGPGARPPGQAEPPLLIQQTPSPFMHVTAGPVTATIPDHWSAELASAVGGLQEGLVASPRPINWNRIDGSSAGMAAVWIDVGRVGVPSDYYYLAATGPALDRLTHSTDCRSTRREVIVDHRPSFFGHRDSPGDYLAIGRGRCLVRGTPMRWAYFVAAPGYGPVRRVGIPSSGLYVVVAVLPDTQNTPELLHKLLNGTRFGGARLADLVAAAES